MGRPEHFAALQEGLGGTLPLIYQEMSPAHPEAYFRDLLDRISLRGVVFAPQVCDCFATGDQGGMVEVSQERSVAARHILAVLNALIEEKLDRERP
jgi:hypothetical protein